MSPSEMISRRRGGPACGRVEAGEPGLEGGREECLEAADCGVRLLLLVYRDTFL